MFVTEYTLRVVTYTQFWGWGGRGGWCCCGDDLVLTPFFFIVEFGFKLLKVIFTHETTEVAFALFVNILLLLFFFCVFFLGGGVEERSVASASVKELHSNICLPSFLFFSFSFVCNSYCLAWVRLKQFLSFLPMGAMLQCMHVGCPS